MQGKCQYCGLDIAIRNPSGNCDHLHYPENANKNYSCPDCKTWVPCDIHKRKEAHPELVPLDNIDKLSHTIKFYSKNYLQVDFSTYGAQKLAEYIALEYGHPKPHSCKCSNNEGARTVRKIDEGLCACPRCGGIVITKQNVPSLDIIENIIHKCGSEYEKTNEQLFDYYHRLAQAIHNLLVKGGTMRITIDLEKLKEIIQNKLNIARDINGNHIIVGFDSVIDEIECQQAKEYYEQ